jgi:hypothetical protein
MAILQTGVHTLLTFTIISFVSLCQTELALRFFLAAFSSTKQQLTQRFTCFADTPIVLHLRQTESARRLCHSAYNTLMALQLLILHIRFHALFTFAIISFDQLRGTKLGTLFRLAAISCAR